MMKLLIASQNPGKIEEMTPLLRQVGFDVTDARTHKLIEPEETGRTFVDNARIKAQAAAAATGMAVLADDSGIIIDALGDFPGVDSKPHMEQCGSYQKAVDHFFEMLNGRPSDCHYKSVMILLFPDGREIIAEGRVSGRLIREPRGTRDFGHDFWFEIPEAGKTFAEMTVEEKNGFSHRKRALQDLITQIEASGELRAVS